MGGKRNRKNTGIGNTGNTGIEKSSFTTGLTNPIGTILSGQKKYNNWGHNIGGNLNGVGSYGLGNGFGLGLGNLGGLRNGSNQQQQQQLRTAVRPQLF